MTVLTYAYIYYFQISKPGSRIFKFNMLYMQSSCGMTHGNYQKWPWAQSVFVRPDSIQKGLNIRITWQNILRHLQWPWFCWKRITIFSHGHAWFYMIPLIPLPIHIRIVNIICHIAMGTSSNCKYISTDFYGYLKFLTAWLNVRMKTYFAKFHVTVC